MGPESAHWTSLLPPLIAILLAIFTRNVIASLLAGVVVGGYFIRPEFLGGLVGAFEVVWTEFWDPDHLLIIGFVLTTLPAVALLTGSGALQVILKNVAFVAQSRQAFQFQTYFLGLAVFIDDYANTFLVGSTMRPLSEFHRVSKEKLAFLVDATAAPVAGIAVLSTWIGYEIGLFQEVSEALDLGVDGYGIFFKIFGFRFYCLLMLAFVFMNIFSKRDFGPMLKAEQASLASKNVQPIDSSTASGGGLLSSLLTFTVPIAVFFVAVFRGLWIDGDGSTHWSEVSLVGAWREALAQADSVLVLARSGLIFLVTALLASMLYVRYAQQRTFFKSGRFATATFIKGLTQAMVPLIILILAWAIKGVCDELSTADFLVQTFAPSVSPLLFPVVVFVLSGFTAFSTGTSWGTMALLIPTLVPVAFALEGDSLGVISLLSFAAVLDGAIFGDHCSPLSDTTIMSSASTGCDFQAHVRTQLPYAVVVGSTAALLYIAQAAEQLPLAFSYIAGIALPLAVLYLIGKRSG